MRSSSDFRIFYNHTIFPELLRLEKYRKRLLLLIGISLFFILLVTVIGLALDILPLTLTLSLIIGIYIYFLIRRIQKFISDFKPLVVNLILDFIDDSINYTHLKYHPKRAIKKADFYKSRLFDSPAQIYEGEDFIEGSIGSVKFELCELNVLEKSKVRQAFNPIFKGVFTKATLEVSMGGKVVILPRDEKVNLTSTIRKLLQARLLLMNQNIKDKGFRNRFLVYADKQAKLKDILSKELQNSIEKYCEGEDKLLYMSFINKDVYIAITEEKNILEPNVLKPNLSYQLVKEFFEDIQLQLKIIEDFDLHH